MSLTLDNNDYLRCANASRYNKKEYNTVFIEKLLSLRCNKRPAVDTDILGIGGCCGNERDLVPARTTASSHT